MWRKKSDIAYIKNIMIVSNPDYSDNF